MQAELSAMFNSSTVRVEDLSLFNRSQDRHHELVCFEAIRIDLSGIILTALYPDILPTLSIPFFPFIPA